MGSYSYQGKYYRYGKQNLWQLMVHTMLGGMGITSYIESLNTQKEKESVQGTES